MAKSETNGPLHALLAVKGMRVTIRIIMLGTIVLLGSACGQQSAPLPVNEAATGDTTASTAPAPATNMVGDTATEIASGNTSTVVTVAPLLGEKVVRAGWSKAANRRSCAPLALKSDAKAGGTPRAATFSGGWAVAFNQPDRRSAYGVAGSGLTPDDRADYAVLVDRLARQWSYVRRWDAGDNLPAGSAAGYGLEGAKDHPAGSSGYGQQSLAYLRIPGQACLYNVWSKLGRDHLELLLSELVLLKP